MAGRQTGMLTVRKLNGNRTQIVMRCTRLDEWTKKQIIAFNKSNTKYHVVLEESAAIGSELQDFKERTDMKIAMGQGADIICSGAVNDAYSLLSKGAFEDLESYMEQSGIKTEDYFPLLSGWIWENKIYGVNIMANVLGVKIDERFVPREKKLHRTACWTECYSIQGKRYLWRDGMQ